VTEAAIAGQVDYQSGMRCDSRHLRRIEKPAHPTLEELLRPENKEALSLADFEDKQ